MYLILIVQIDGICDKINSLIAVILGCLMMKILILFLFSLLTACTSTGSYNNQQIKTQCAIGYHQEYSVSRVLYDSENKNKESKTKSKISEEFRCVADSDKDKLLNPQHY